MKYRRGIRTSLRRPGTSSASADGALHRAGTQVERAMAQYRSELTRCQAAASPVVCLEAADRTLGGKIHDYANVLALGHHFAASAADLSAARDQAQTLANSLEILGDAQPTRSNYDHVLNGFDVSSALTRLQQAVHRLDAATG